MQCLRYHSIIQISFGIEVNLVQISDKIRFLRVLRVSIEISQTLHSFEASDNIRAELRPRIKSFFNLKMQDSFHCCSGNHWDIIIFTILVFIVVDICIFLLEEGRDTEGKFIDVDEEGVFSHKGEHDARVDLAVLFVFWFVLLDWAEFYVFVGIAHLAQVSGYDGAGESLVFLAEDVLWELHCSIEWLLL